MITEVGIRVLVVEDHQVMTDALCDLLDDQPDIGIVGAARTVVGPLQAVHEHAPDVVLMNHRPADGDGPTAAIAILRARPATAIVFLSADAGPRAREEAARAGAAAHLLKSDATAPLADVVRRVARGESLIGSS